MKQKTCSATVSNRDGWGSSCCSRGGIIKGTKGYYCRQHHPDAVAKRRAISEATYDKKTAEWRKERALKNHAESLYQALKSLLELGNSDDFARRQAELVIENFEYALKGE